ncbi:unnamed protein product, partial [Closterium sp. NIES-53]
FYHPTLHRVLLSQDVTFDESVPFYRLFPYRSAPPPPPPLFLASGPPQVAVGSGAAPGAASGGAEPGGVGSEGAGSGGAEPRGAEPEGVERGGAELEGAESGGAEPRGAVSSGGPAGASLRLSSQQLRATVPTGAGGTGGVGCTGAQDPTGPGAAGAGRAGAGVAGVGGTGAGGAGAAGAGAVDPGAGGAGDTMRPRLYLVPLLQQVLGVPSSTGLPPSFLCPPPVQSQPPLQLASPLPAPSPYTERSGGLTQGRERASRPVSPVHTAHRAPRSRPPPVPGMHTMALHPSSVPLRVPLPAPPESSLPELLDFATACRLNYASAVVAESVSASPPSVKGESDLGTDVLEDRQEDFECLAADVPQAITNPYSSQWQAAMDAEMATWKSIGTYIDAVSPSRANIVDGMWIFRVKRSSGSPPAFKARFARGFRQGQGVDYFQTFSLTPKMTTLRVLLHVAAQCDYVLHSLDFSTPFLQGSLHEEIWLHLDVSCRYSVELPPASLRSLPGASRVARHTEDYTCGPWVCSFYC